MMPALLPHVTKTCSHRRRVHFMLSDMEKFRPRRDNLFRLSCLLLQGCPRLLRYEVSRYILKLTWDQNPVLLRLRYRRPSK